MANLIWNDVCNTGQEFIDEDHKNIVKLLVKLQEQISSVGQQQQCIALFVELHDLVKSNFSRKEIFLAEIKYPDIDACKAMHKTLLVRFVSARRVFDGLSTDQEMGDCLSNISQLLLEYITRFSLRIKSHLDLFGYPKTG